MTAHDEPAAPSERMRRLERKAEVIRSRLVRAVDALDVRRHQVVAVGKQAKAMAKPAMISLVGLAALAGIGAFAIGAALRSRRRSLKSRLSDGAAHAIAKFDRAREPSLHRKMFDRIAVTVVTFAVSELVKRVTKNMADGRSPDGRLANGRLLANHRDDVEVRTVPSNGPVI